MKRQIALWLIFAGVALLSLMIVQVAIGNTALAAPGAFQQRPTLPPPRPTVGQPSNPTAKPEQPPAATAAPDATTAPAEPTAEIAPAVELPAASPQTMPATGTADRGGLAALVGLAGCVLILAGIGVRVIRHSQ